MRSLNDYTKQKQDELFDKYKVFFAFSNEQLNEELSKHDLLPDTKLVSRGAGMYMPKDGDNVQRFDEEFDNVLNKAIKQRLADYGENRIMDYEFSNYECAYSMSPEDAKPILSDYGFTDEQINKRFAVWMRLPSTQELF